MRSVDIVGDANTHASPQNRETTQEGVPDKPLRSERYWWGDIHTGTREQLIAAGFIKAGMFPGDPDRGKVTQSYTADGQPLRHGQQSHIKVRRVSKATFSVSVDAAPDEVQRRKAAADARSPEALKKAADIEATINVEQQRLAEMPATPQAYAQHAAEQFWAHFNAFFIQHLQSFPHASGFRFSGATIEHLEGLATALWNAIKDAEPAYHPDRRLRKLNELRGQAAKLNPALQAFISTAIATPLHEPAEQGGAS